MNDKTPGTEALIIDDSERRIHQRFVARIQGEPCFWVTLGNRRFPLNDLSLKGMSLTLQGALVEKGAQFGFTLERTGMPDKITGRAEVAAVFGANAGCRILSLDEENTERLHEWLVTHVIRSATVRISEKDAAAIVAGSSLI